MEQTGPAAPDGALRSETPPRRRATAAHLAILTLAQLALAVPWLSSVPRFYDDEAWHGSVAYELSRSGRLRHPILVGWGGIDQHLVHDMVVLPIFSAPVYRMTGFDVATARLPSVAMSVLALWAVYAFGRRLLTSRAALAATLATAAHPWFFEISRRVRPEIYYLALGLAGAWGLTAALQTGRRRWAFLGGAAMGLAATAHPTGLLLGASLAAGLLIWLGRPWALRVLGWATLGGACVLASFAAYVLWAQAQSPQVSFVEQMKGTHELFAGGASNMIRGELGRWREFLGLWYGAPLAAVLAMAMAAAWWRSTRGDKAVATAIVLYALSMFVTSNFAARYLAPVVPLFAVLTVRLLARLTAGGRSLRVWPRAAAGVLAAAYLAVSAGGIGLMLWRLHNADLRPLLNRIMAAAPGDSRIYGHMMLWMHPSRRCEPSPIDNHWQTTADMLRQWRFEYIVRFGWDWRSSHGVAQPPRTMPPLGKGHIPAIEASCLQYGALVESLWDDHFGAVEIYRMDWDKP
jgi:4-amino-4-deoxy-L-arabinose transferase-like glycosyltransferase